MTRRLAWGILPGCFCLAGVLCLETVKRSLSRPFKFQSETSELLGLFEPGSVAAVPSVAEVEVGFGRLASFPKNSWSACFFARRICI